MYIFVCEDVRTLEFLFCKEVCEHPVGHYSYELSKIYRHLDSESPINVPSVVERLFKSKYPEENT